MGRNVETSKLVDEIIRYGVGGTAIVGSIALPGLAHALKKPLDELFKHLDNREKERQLQKALYYMKAQGYLLGTYQHGLQLTERARKRILEKDTETSLTIPRRWDGWWRVVIYDIPENRKHSRESLQQKLKLYGFVPLQKSVYITPFPCLEEIEQFAVQRNVDAYITYFEAKNLANATEMIKVFSLKYPQTTFK